MALAKHVVASTPTYVLLPFEKAVLSAAATALDPETRVLLLRQVAAINHVQRLLDWKSIEFYCKKWFLVRWPAAVLFPRRDEHRLAQVQCRFGDAETTITVWAVGGHVFSLESPAGLSGLSISGPFNLVSAQALVR